MTGGPLTSRLERRRILDGAWSRYVLAGLEPEGVEREIALSWQRSREIHRIDPQAARPPRILPDREVAARRLLDEAYLLADPILRDFTDRLSLSDHVLAWFDAEGWLLSMGGDAALFEPLAGIGFAPGANWSEASAGTNGPGTALASRRAVEVFASEHFARACQPWSCAAAPLLSRDGAEALGAVDITGPWEVRRRQALLVVRLVARAVEERLRAGLGVRDAVIRYAVGAARTSGEALAAVDGHGRVLASNAAASRSGLVEGGWLPPGLAEQVARSLSAERRGEFAVALPDGDSARASPIEFEGVPLGAVLRVAPAAPPRPRRRSAPAARYDFATILGASEPFCAALERARAAARVDLPAVLLGESGTGKELFAHAIHAASARRAGPFVAVNCGSIPAELVEAEFFGYEAGTFTGAKREGSAGRLEDADGGTLFLDEVSELSAAAQTALLRVLQEKEVVRLGGSAPRPVDVRVLAASNRPLDDEVRAGRFRRDLYYRLHVLGVRIPPLRERGDDVVLLAGAFLAAAEAEVGRADLSLAPDAIAALRAHPWPGNVRELRNAVLRAAATCAGDAVGAADLALEPCPAPAEADSTPPGPLAVRELEHHALVAAIDACGGNLSEAARQLGISRATVYRWMTRHRLART
ncbi:MAG TPA: sigma-54-dependent Fis family transcriptional regulator [Anaeromyxobacteraceae bacterium]|nr:sigma-54-dependent Fis family transcriptional regulator [Anaeromyxobacteraceae bacterium]